MSDKLLTVKDVIDKLRVSRQTLYQLTRNGKIASVNIGRSVRYKESEINKFIKSLEPVNA